LRSIAQAMLLEGWPQATPVQRPSFETQAIACGRRLAPRDEESECLETRSFLESLGSHARLVGGRPPIRRQMAPLRLHCSNIEPMLRFCNFGWCAMLMLVKSHPKLARLILSTIVTAALFAAIARGLAP
ncbi:hypothetical protein, partial [Bradyrhizobium sp.]|uniref:hypothetical protein n=1 Tax=Bradyrhizobium sp. TaxID=376 RepID=UPI003C57E091